MAITTEDPTPQDVTAAGAVVEGDTPPEPLVDEEGVEVTEEPLDEEQAPFRIALALAFPVIAAAVMVGGVFLGISPRIYAAAGGLLGVGLAVLASRLRKPLGLNLAVIGGLFAIGLLCVLPTGPGNLGNLGGLVSEAATSGDVLRPPVPFTPGWAAIIGWLMGIVGFATGWIALVIRRPSLSLVLPLPVAAVAAISVTEAAKVPSGIAALVLFAVGLGLLASATAVGEEDERPPIGYEIRKALRSLLLLLPVVGLLVLASQSDFLFPKPYIDPTQEPQKPKTTPLSEVPDRPLFDVESPITGPWRIGALDVYDGKDWRLPPFAESELDEVPRNGVVDEDLEPGVRATFTISGLEGAVLPGLPNPVGIVAEGPKLAYDPRSANIRVNQGAIQAGLQYTVAAAALPRIEDLQAITSPFPPKEAAEFAEIPIDMPPAVAELIRQAPKTSKWDEFDFLRSHVLAEVTATGAGVPKSIDGARVQDMLAGSKEGTPFEIVAAQAMLARWIGVPSRIGYGFDGGEKIGDKLQVRPRNGATFVEVYFPGFKWLPVIGVPEKAKPTVGEDAGEQQFDPNILPSDEVSVQLYLPVLVPPGSIFYEQLRNVVAIVVPVLLLLGLIYVLAPAVRKSRLRGRRRAAAEAAGPRARIALAYAEWRDHATDFGFDYPTDTPLMFLDRFIEDEEHTELGWLTTRALWGDLQDSADVNLAAVAEELSRALKRRLASAQPATVRAVALVSRLSLRRPYAPETDLSTTRSTRRREKKNNKEAELATASA